MKTRLIIIGLAAMLAAGCYNLKLSKELSKVHLGMNEQEVVQILGEPASVAESKDGTKTLFYTLCEGRIENQYAPYSVKLVNGKVDSYGRDGGATQRSPAIVPVVVPAAH